ncbi:MAG: hypothetical protein ACE5HI_14225, partial [bacterium]
MAEREIEVLDLVNWRGIFTKFAPEILKDEQLSISVNTDYFNSYGAITKSKGLRRILNSRIVEHNKVVPITWVGFYKAADFNGQILRHVLIAYSDKIARVEPDGTLTDLIWSGSPNLNEKRIPGLFHQSDRFFDRLLIQNQDPQLIGRGSSPVKYDGKEITRWGVLAPGTEETIIEDFSSPNKFDLFNGTLAGDTVTTQSGNSVSFTKTATNSSRSHFQLFGFFLDASADVKHRVGVKVFIPRGELNKMATGAGGWSSASTPTQAQLPALSVYFGSSPTQDKFFNMFDGPGATNYYRFDFTVGQLFEGWNTLTFDFQQNPTSQDAPNTKNITN